MASGTDYNQIVPSGSHDPFDRIPPEINEMILAHLSIADLLSCGFVSKSWKRRSRSHLQNHRECCAYVKNPCRDLLALNNQMSRYDLSMINGIHIRNDNAGRCRDVRDCCQVLMHSPWKYLYVNMALKDERRSDVKLVKALIRATRISLIKLVVHFAGSQRSPFFDFLLASAEGNAFPSLMVLESRGDFMSYSKCYELLPTIAPKLQDIYGRVIVEPFSTLNMSLFRCFREVSMSVINNWEIEGRSTSARSPYRPLADHLSNLRALEIDCNGYPPHDNRCSLESLLDILHKNHDTLEEIFICAFDLLQYQNHYPKVRFPMLKAFDIRRHFDEEGVDDFPYVKRAIFQHVNNPRFFPNLKEMVVDPRGLTSGETEPFLELDDDTASPVNQETLILKLSLYDDERDDIKIFGKLLRRVITLNIEVIKLGFENVFHLADAFLVCPVLKELFIVVEDNDADLSHVSSGKQDSMMDALLCGIHVDEVAYILEQHRSGTLDLKELNIVPVRPSITFAPNLKRFCFRDIRHRGWKEQPRKVTEVSGYLAFRRMPQVEVILEISFKFRREYAHLTSFANIVYVD